MMLLWVVLLATLCQHSTRADLLCATSGHTGCSISCAVTRRGEGICEESVETKAYNCRCFSKDAEPSIFTTEQQTSLEEHGNYINRTSRNSSTAVQERAGNQGVPWFAKQIIFFPVVRSGFFGFFRVLSDPRTYSLQNAANYRIPSGNGSLGSWHIWPESSEKRELASLDAEDTLVVYMHGNSATRGFGHRIKLYRIFTELGYHVLSFDYRGFGDSSEIDLSEDTVVEDGVNVLRWLEKQLNTDGRSPEELPLILVWGHSLGTAVATHSLYRWQNLQQVGFDVSGLVLESPFTTMKEEVQTFALGRFLGSLLAGNTTDILKRANTEFLNSYYLPRLNAPTLILHAEDDKIVPAKLGAKLANESIEAGKTNLRFKLYPAELRLRHRYMYLAPGLQQEIEDLWLQASEFRRGVL